MKTGDIIKARRLALGLTLDDVGARVGVGKSTVRKWEIGLIENMRRDKIAKLAEVLEIDPNILVGAAAIIPKEKPAAGVGDELSENKQALMKLVQNCSEEDAGRLLQIMQLFLDNAKQGS